LFFGLTFEPEMLETQSRALKTRILALNPKILRAKILARGSDDDVIRLTKKHTVIMIPLAQNPHPNF